MIFNVLGRKVSEVVEIGSRQMGFGKAMERMGCLYRWRGSMEGLAWRLHGHVRLGMRRDKF